MADSQSNLRIAVIYTHYPHYRQPVFLQMSRSQDFEYQFYYDPQGVEKTIKTGQPLGNHHVLNTQAKGRFYFQWGAIKLAMQNDFAGYIFLGNPYILTTWLAAGIVRLRGLPLFYWTHGWLRRETGLKGFFRNQFYRIADGLLVYGKRAKEIGIENGFSPDSIHVVYNSLDYKVQKEVRLSLQDQIVKSAKPYFLCVTRLVDDVNLELAFRAAKLLKAEHGKDFDFVIVGDGPMRSELELKAKEYGIDAHFLGAVYDERKLAELFMGCAAVVSPGKVGLLAMHALAYGAPVITHKDLNRQMPEVEAIEDGFTGGFFEYGSADDLAGHMLDYLENGPRKGAVDAAIERIERDYTPEVQSRRIDAALLTEAYK